MPILLLALLLPLAVSQPFQPSPTIPPPFCANPPTANLTLPPYFTGRWYQLYTAGFASRFSSNRCVTANYTFNPDATVAVLNCQTRPSATRAECVVGVASSRNTGLSGQLQVRFPPGPNGDYNVAALLGEASYGYFAAAVFNCELGRESYFIISRTPFMPETTLALLVQQLRGRGYPVDVLFERSDQRMCVYFDSGFEVTPPMPPPVPGVGPVPSDEAVEGWPQ